METPLDVLGLNHTATLSDVRRRYRQLALENHPDKQGGPKSHERFVAIQAAYEFLIKVAPADKYSDFQGPFLRSRWEVWHEEKDSPSFHDMLDLLRHLRLDTQDLSVLHNDCLFEIHLHGRAGSEGYTRRIAQIISNLEEESNLLLKRCVKINQSECMETENWISNMAQVKELQHDTVLRLNSSSLMFLDLSHVQSCMRGKGKLGDKEWHFVLRKLRDLALRKLTPPI